MIYPTNIEQKLGFDQVRELVEKQCTSTLGLHVARKMQFTTNFTLVQRLLEQTAEMQTILAVEDTFPRSHYHNIIPIIKKAEPEGAWLDPAEFLLIAQVLGVMGSIFTFFKKKEIEFYPRLRELLTGLVPMPNMQATIERVVDENGNVRDSASSELQHIRSSLVKEHHTLRRRLDSIMKWARGQNMLAEGMEVTIRNGRMCIPILAEHKRHIKGFIHDESGTGQTVFMEPAEVFEINNNIKDLEIQERREIVKILTQLTEKLRPLLGDLRRMAGFLGIIDFIAAKAKFANLINATLPRLEKKQGFTWAQARHPLLELKLKAEGRSIMPLDISLSAEKRIMVISGPNAGGKSICLKTVGLLQYMLQCGLLLPIKAHSECGIFEELFADIGDEQSLENDLSTYSSHLQNMSYILKMGGKKSLLLIDEFGTGTEPQFGGAIAEAVLQELNKAQMFGVITTHYGNLKALGDKEVGIINASMQFDTKAMQPLFRLEIGKPGSSYALEIAERMGLPKKLLANAREKLGPQVVNYDKLIAELENELADTKLTLKRTSEKEVQLDKLKHQYAELKELLDSQKKQLMNDAKAQAKELIKQANQRIEQTIREIKENQAAKEATKTSRDKLKEMEASLQPEAVAKPVAMPKKADVKAEKALAKQEKPAAPVKTEPTPTEFTNGGFAKFKDGETVVQVVNVSGKEAEVLIGQLKSYVKLNRLQPISRQEFIAASASDLIVETPKGMNITNKMASFSATLDLRGMRGEEAMPRLESFMDDALLLGAQELRILHGKGDGILRKLTRQTLQQYKQVASMSDEHADRGGAGITVVTLA